MPRAFINKGKKVGKLVVEDVFTKRINGNSISFYKCRCECGNLIEVKASTYFEGYPKSCGCDKNKNLNPAYLRSKEKVNVLLKLGFGSFQAMKARCYNENTYSYKYYGEKGIRVCERWMNKKNGWNNFLEDMGARPGSEYTLDRIDSKGDYTPENCRWATPKEQTNNMKNNVIVDGMSIEEFAKKYGLKKGTLRSRLRNGWNLEEIKRGEREIGLIINNVCIKTFARQNNLSYNTVWYRIKNGWTLDEIKKGKKEKFISCLNGYTPKEFSKKYGIKYGTLMYRLNNGWSLEEILDKNSDS